MRSSVSSGCRGAGQEAWSQDDSVESRWFSRSVPFDKFGANAFVWSYKMGTLAIPSQPDLLMSHFSIPDDANEPQAGPVSVDPESSFALMLRTRAGDEAAIE